MQIETLNTNYQKDLAKIIATAQEEGCDEGQMTLLNHHLSTFQQYGLPSTKNEQWKYTALGKFLPEQLNLYSPANGPTQAPSDYQTFGSSQVLFINGILQKDSLPKGVEVIQEELQTEFAKGDRTAQDQLEVINLIANTRQASYHLQVSDQAEIDFLHYFDSPEDALFCPRLQVTIRPNTSLKVYQQVFSPSAKALWINPTIKVTVEANAHVEWNLHSALNNEQVFTPRYQVDVKRDGSFKLTQNSHSEKLIRNDFLINLLEENAVAELGGFYQVKDHQHHDTTLIINHYKSHTNSHQLFKGILDNEARAVFNGMVFIHQDAQQVDATQLNKNLLLSPKAHVDTRPQLQVYADDVKAAHGATVGQLDEDELFYLMARGIPQSRATNLLLAGYGGQVFENISSQAWKDFIQQTNQKH